MNINAHVVLDASEHLTVFGI